MILKDQALVLRMYPFGNTSRIVVWLSPDYGKLATLVKGSQRGKSPFLGQYDSFYTCEILFYARSLHILKECAPLDARPGLRTDWRACAVASYAAGAIDRAVPFGGAALGLYRLLEETLDSLASRTPGPAFILRFELHLLRELGLAPGWTHCGKCGTRLPDGASARLNAAAGSLLCLACAGEGRGLPISGATLEAIRLMGGEHMPASIPERVFVEIRDVFGGLLEHHADLDPHPRNLAFQILRTT
ncbi:MAG: DNA repair protein RecO [Verrucomicrobiota bacterium]|jgi:DNA repair protein RecO (recombination protein O)|nr:DNA repair protein RecO [Verrucomicrobiota bacterium]